MSAQNHPSFPSARVAALLKYDETPRFRVIELLGTGKMFVHLSTKSRGYAGSRFRAWSEISAPVGSKWFLVDPTGFPIRQTDWGFGRKSI